MINIREINDLKEAERLWRILSPNKTIFDEWDFRFCFYKYDPCPLRFFAAWEEDGGREAVVGLMPLQYNKDWGGLEFFAEDPCEENRPFVKVGYEKIIPDLYAAIPSIVKCHDISGSDAFTTAFDLEDYKYVLPLANLNDFKDFLNSRLSAKRRRSLSKELAEIEKNKIEILIDKPIGASDDLELLFSFNYINFEGESYLREQERAPWRDLLKLPFDWRLVVLRVNGAKQAVSLSVLFNGEWHYLITGVNFKDFPGLGKLLAKVNIEAAIAAEATFFDAGLGDCGWKNLWHLDLIPQYEFEKFVE